ncbi:MAG: hypothetical protein IJB79_07080 [Candidatus Gastranaerophilales bacterium]|nr:hypothetical protein [Candidatus Gastranaerophilales bacterium]
MISRLQSNSSLHFKGAELSPALKARVEANAAQKQETAIQEQPKKKASVTETYNKAKKGVTDIFKGVNTITNVGTGIIRGAVDGVALTATAGVIGKAISETKDMQGLKVLSHIIGQTIGDFAKGAWKAIKFIPSIITKSPLENAKTILTLPKKFYGSKAVLNGEEIVKEATGYLKGNKKVAIAATAIGLCALAFRTIQGKINANDKNADIDHKTNQGHV